MTTADWLRRAADFWDEADAAQGAEARQAKVNLAEEYERLAKHAAYLAHHHGCLAGDDQIDALIGRNRDLLEQAEAARMKTQQLKAEHHLMTLQALETRPLIRSNRRYRRIALGKHDPLVLVPREGKQPRRHQRTDPASEAGQKDALMSLGHPRLNRLDHQHGARSAALHDGSQSTAG